ncbi:MAG TPA: hypothetical protein VGL78_04185 [Solirubrobacteraceae bacterium]|jgi:hypothetical protein
MDINCPRCGEPWELDHVYHEMTSEERADLIAGRGCSSECASNPRSDSLQAQGAGAILELCPDDLDGAAALMEDFGLTL